MDIKIGKYFLSSEENKPIQFYKFVYRNFSHGVYIYRHGKHETGYQSYHDLDKQRWQSAKKPTAILISEVYEIFEECIKKYETQIND